MSHNHETLTGQEKSTVAWTDWPSQFPWLDELTEDDLTGLYQWIQMRMSQINPSRTSNMLNQALLDWGFFQDHQQWRSPTTD